MSNLLRLHSLWRQGFRLSSLKRDINSSLATDFSDIRKCVLICLVGNDFPKRLLSTQPSGSFEHDDTLMMNEGIINNNADASNAKGKMGRIKIRDLRLSLLHHCKKRGFQAAENAEKILHQLVEESILTGEQLANPALHNNCLNAWAKSNSKKSFLKASKLLEAMHRRHDKRPDACPSPNNISYHSALMACANCASLGNPDATTKAEELIKKMEHLDLKNPGGDVFPTTYAYNLVMLAHANQAPEKYGAANDAEDWLRYLSRLNTQGGCGPDSMSFNTVLRAWNFSPEDKGADRALELLHLMIKLFRDGHHDQISPSPTAFEMVIDAFARRHRPSEAEDVLKIALSFFLEDGYININQGKTIDLRKCFNMAINGWAKCKNSSDAPERADALFHDMRAISQETEVLITEPDVFTYTSCMEAMANSGRPDAPEIVESRIYSMLEQHRRTNGRTPLPSAVTFDCAIQTWYRSQREHREKQMLALLDASIELAQRRDDTLLLPQPRTVNTCIQALCRAGQGKSDAMLLLNRMEVVGCVSAFSYLPFIKQLLSNAKEFNDDDCVFAAAKVLEKFQSQVKYKGLFKWPKHVTDPYMDVFFAFHEIAGKNAFAADQAVKLLEGMEANAPLKAKPTCQAYSVVISALAKRPNSQRAEKALAIYEHVIRLHHDPKSKVKADKLLFQSILSYLANTKRKWAADRACKVMDTMLKMNSKSASSNTRLRPNFRCYDKCLQAVARCGDEESCRKAVSMLTTMDQEFRQARAPDLPSEAGINTVLKYCGRLGTDEGSRLTTEVSTIKEELRRDGHLHANLESENKNYNDFE